MADTGLKVAAHLEEDPLDHLMRYARMAFARELTNQSILELKRMRGVSSP